MRKLVILLMLGLLVFVGLSVPVLAEEKGPVADKIYVNVRMSEDVGIKDTAEGMTDIFFWGVNGPQVLGLDKATRDKLEIYSVPAGSWSININPIPNKAPYTLKVGDKEYFNPLAIKKVRFALNFLINRKYLVDEILGGCGGPMFTMATPGQPGTYKYNLIATRMGMTPEGDEEKALNDIEEAMESAAALPENKGKLVKGEKWWMFNSEPVTIKFLIRVDDPQGRLKEGQYISQQIEKAGIKVDRLLWDRVKCIKTSYYSDPKDYLWNMYTEGWGAGATRAFWEHIVCQMYAPWYGYMAGGADPDHWNYENEEITRLTKKAYTGDFLTEKEYWDIILPALKMGLEDSCRIYTAYQDQYYVANKARFNKRFLYGLGDGLNRWTNISADTKDKILRITEFSAKGGLFMSAWDPVGTEGFNDVFSLVLEEPLYDQGMFESPSSAIPTALRTVPKDVDTKVHKDAATGKVVGDISVPTNAIKYDSGKKAWIKVGTGVKAMSKCTYSFRFGNFHHGQPMGIADVLYAEAFIREWITKDGEDDKYYDAPYSSKLTPDEETIKGWVLNPDGTITTYFDYNFPPSKERVASWGAPWISVTAAGQPVAVSWEITEALAKLVVEGSKSGTVYSFNPDVGTEVDLLAPSCVKDIKAKLEEMKENNYVPVSIKDYVTVDEAKARYDAAINWIDEHGHAFISCGPYYLEKYNPTTSFMQLNAFRDPTYPFTSDYWPKALAATRLRIDSIDVPAIYPKGEDISVKVRVSEVLYPENTAKLAEHGSTAVTLITPTGEFSYDAKYVEPGLFEATIPGDTTEDLESGTYLLLASASMKGAVPGSASVKTIIY